MEPLEMPIKTKRNNRKGNMGTPKTTQQKRNSRHHYCNPERKKSKRRTEKHKKNKQTQYRKKNLTTQPRKQIEDNIWEN